MIFVVVVPLLIFIVRDLSNKRSELAISVLHYVRAVEMADQLLLPLNSRIPYLTHLARSKPLPPGVVKILVEWLDVLQVDEVDERVPDVAVVVLIHWKVEKVVAIFEVLIDVLEDHAFGVVIGDVSDHQRGFVDFQDVFRVDNKLVVL